VRRLVLARALAVALAALAADAAPARAGAAPARRFAIVIGNNTSERADTRDLRYADDDAVAMHRLLRQAGVASSLFVTLDAASRSLHPGLVPDGRPRWSALRDRMVRLEQEIGAARRAGAATTLIVFYSGHGDVAGGEGYVELEDQHLTRTLLRREILDRSAADEIHLVVDACRSYYLAFEKGPGGRRRAGAHGPLIDRPRARTGYILSTSSDRDSHEWEAFQGGIFSHEVRSGLRGAADVDRDGSVTYAELGAFLAVANRGIRNPRFRPDFVVRPPGDLSDELLRWDEDRAAQTLLLDVPGQGHMVLEGPAGERLLDVNAADGQELLVHLPDERPLFLRRSKGDREFAIEAGRVGPLRVSGLLGAPVRVASKGALHLAFAQLFSASFGALDVERYREALASAVTEDASPVAAVQRSQTAAEGGGRRAARWTAGALAIGAGAAGLGLAGWAIERSVAAHATDEQDRRRDLNGTVEGARLATGVALGVAASAAIAWWLLDGDGPAPARLTVAPTAAADGALGISIASWW
jgi:hypothetical protein